MKPHSLIAIGLVTLLFPSIARADDAPAPAPPPEEKKDEVEVRVIGDRADSLQKVPGSGTVISQKDIQRADPVQTAEMLRRVPGVQVREEYSGGSRLDVSIRGLESGRSRRVLMLEDGIPMALNPYSESDMNYAPSIERYRAIEVVKGSGNILFGPQTLAGTINFVTIMPPDHQSGTVDVDAGTYGYVRALANYGDTLANGDVRYVVQILQRHGDGFRDQPFNSTDGLAKMIFPTGKNGEAVVKLGFRRDDASSDDIGLTTPMWLSDPKRTTLAPHDHLILDNYSASLTHEQRFSADTKLKTLVYVYETPRIWRRQDWVRTPVAGESYERIVGDTTIPNGAIYFKNTDVILDRNYDVMGVEPRAEHRFATGGVAHTLDFGGRALRETAHYDQRTGTNPYSYSGTNDYEETHAGYAFAAYAQDRMAFRDDLLVTPGIRFEHLEFHRDVIRQNVGNGVVDVNQEGDKSVSGLIPGIGIITGTKRANVFGGMHFGWAPPRVTSAISPRGVPADVHADESMNYEVGSRVAPWKWLRAEATGFLSNFNNQVIVNTDPSSDTNLTDAGATNLYGVESALTVAFDKALALPAIVELGVRYTFSRATFRYGPDSGKLLPYSPEHTGSANFDVEHKSGFGGQIAYVLIGKQYTDAINTEAPDITGSVGAIAAHGIMDATIHYKHKPSGLSARLTAKNLFDATYIAARRPNGIFPGGFRQILLGLRWDWDAPKRD